MDLDVKTVRSGVAIDTIHKLTYYAGVSGVTTGATEISMNLVVIPPGARAEPHVHERFEAAIYLLKGRVETRYGSQLEKSVINEPGDFLFIPAGVPHQPINLSETEPAIGIVARNDPNEQESVHLYKVPDPSTDMK